MNTMDMLCDSYYSHDEFVKQARDFAKKTLFTDSWTKHFDKVVAAHMPAYLQFVESIDPGPTRYGKNVTNQISVKF